MIRLLPLVLLAACGPVSVEQAERTCLEEARLAQAPRGEVAVGVGTGGPRARVDITLSSDYVLQRDPETVFNACVNRKSGRLPTRPLAQQPGY